MRIDVKTALAGKANIGAPGGAVTWGSIEGTLSSQTDLDSALSGKSATSHDHSGVYATAGHNHTGTYEPAGAVSDTAYGAGWDGDTTHAPSKNAVYDKIQTMGGGVSMSDVYPVGSVYISVVSTSPATLFGIGTWAAIGAGRVLVGIDSGDTDFDTVEETGGAKTVASAGTNAAEAAHTHTYTEVPNHVHVLNGFPTATGGSTGFTRDTSMSGTPANTGLSTNNPTGGVASGTTSAGSSHNHTFTGSATSVVQPYFVVYMWKRTA
jgi:hypothetical protein